MVKKRENMLQWLVYLPSTCESFLADGGGCRWGNLVRVTTTLESAVSSSLELTTDRPTPSTRALNHRYPCFSPPSISSVTSINPPSTSHRLPRSTSESIFHPGCNIDELQASFGLKLRTVSWLTLGHWMTWQKSI